MLRRQSTPPLSSYLYDLAYLASQFKVNAVYPYFEATKPRKSMISFYNPFEQDLMEILY